MSGDTHNNVKGNQFNSDRDQFIGNRNVSTGPGDIQDYGGISGGVTHHDKRQTEFTRTGAGDQFAGNDHVSTGTDDIDDYNHGGDQYVDQDAVVTGTGRIRHGDIRGEHQNVTISADPNLPVDIAVGNISGNDANIAVGSGIRQHGPGGHNSTKPSTGTIYDYGGVGGNVNSGSGAQTNIRAGDISGNRGNIAIGSGITQNGGTYTPSRPPADPKATALLDKLDLLRDSLDGLHGDERNAIRPHLSDAIKSLRGGTLVVSVVAPALQQAADAMKDWDRMDAKAALLRIAATAGITLR